MSKLLVKFEWDVRRMGTVEGLFVTTQEEIDAAIGKEIYFGEILGKHSEISGTLDKEDITVVSEDQDFIEKLIQLLGYKISGYCPFDYFAEGEEEDE
jgi:hypothetical protein